MPSCPMSSIRGDSLDRFLDDSWSRLLYVLVSFVAGAAGVVFSRWCLTVGATGRWGFPRAVRKAAATGVSRDVREPQLVRPHSKALFPLDGPGAARTTKEAPDERNDEPPPQGCD
jgi:hypothetical protein